LAPTPLLLPFCSRPAPQNRKKHREYREFEKMKKLSAENNETCTSREA
jgi:hypothetical protein